MIAPPGPTFREPARHGRAVDQLHDDVQLAIGAADVVDGQHVRVRQRREQLRLAEESPPPFFSRRSGARLAQALDRDLARQLGVEGRVHDAHPAGAERFEQAIALAEQPSGGTARRRDRPRQLGERPRAGEASIGVCFQRPRLVLGKQAFDEPGEGLVAWAARPVDGHPTFRRSDVLTF